MLDPQTQAILQDIVRRESRSLLLYIGDAFPWTTSDGLAGLATLRLAIREVANAVTELGRFLVKNRVTPPQSGAYPAWYTSWNFIALSFLVPKLLDAERHSLAALEADRKLIKGEAAKAQVDALLGHRRHALAILEGLQATAPEPRRRADVADLIDTHAHLFYEHFDGDRPEVIARARAAGVVEMIAIGTTAETSARCLELANQYEGVWATAGVHPNEILQAGADARRRVAELLTMPRVVGVGETGLDRYWKDTPFDVQEEWFAWHLERGLATDKPVVIHCRDAEADMLRVLRGVFDRHGPIKGVMHSFVGSMAAMEAYVAMGLHLSFAGMLTYKNAAELREVAAKAPRDRLLVETDSPYLSPVPLRGKRNEPANVRLTAEVLAQAQGLPLEELAAVTTRNARGLFGLGGQGG